MDPNTQHQCWSFWTFTILDVRRIPPMPLAAFRDDARRWVRQTFRTSMGEVRVQCRPFCYTIECRVEGIPAHDPGVVAFVRQQFQQNFVAKGFGPLASSTVTARILAGDQQDGKPRAQLLVVPAVQP